MVARGNIVLVVDDDRAVAETHASLLEQVGCTPLIQNQPENVELQIERRPDIDLVLLDIRMPGLDGMELLHRIKVRWPQMGVIMATVITDIEAAVRSIKTGAYNYLLKPIQPERLRDVLQSFFENHPRRLVEDPRFAGFVTGCPAFEEIFRTAKSFAEENVPVLIQGETGTGKELIAQLIHTLSLRGARRFLAVNVSALSPSLFESELFGHSKGAFTGALQERAGYFEQAGDGTLFLDEIGELGLEQQKKLLRVLQSLRFSRVGETAERLLEARLVFATNHDLRKDVEEGIFREDLYYRLANYAVSLPPLRERKGDVELLSNYFLRKYASQFGRTLEGIAPETMTLLAKYPYPGNVRELEGILSACVLLEQSNRIRPLTLPKYIQFEERADRPGKIPYRAIVRALIECRGNQTRAAEKLGIARQTLNRILREYQERGGES